ncbi:Glyoxalase/Bleomycin resistance protein/Dihydroxybiphenyl dioxygenase [Mollisia scopiformis]|uniref:Glyoxalase/Bleomycin resistance protein/Dihydroxybiphenyl dioxygenase n=1 Tax=Mollisia scopiformis TaxID=149040 RepID=A0A194WXW8_MOLSC|nr:Glyoxalase/Bleomycin resistance protein/Dihydroxybiphenyl dioxygenase [Mollisia scopiformis]KUJ12816.1 Glyoxalase/Bleomycin resistance protein/Dihydroxybiphenyl dioxygenase [Mollisia scopiformis]
MSESSAMRNCISWVEIPATDLNRAKEFYSAVFGWSFPNFGSSPIDSFMAIFSHGSTNGCLVKVEAENLLSAALHPDNAELKRVGVRVTITVESVDKKMAEVESKGGKLYLEKTEIPGGMGFVSYFTDTEGNVMGLWSKE